MLAFLHGWKRKVGCVTLLLACVFMAGWVRSPIVTDFVSYSTGVNAIDEWFSTEGVIGWKRYRVYPELYAKSHPGQLIAIQGPPYPTWSTASEGTIRLSIYKWRWRWFGFGVTENELPEGEWMTFIVVPYWSVTMPPTLVAACLLLWKPRKRVVT